jgi:transcriptional regulator with GAF, ATPase, and Fis domain
VEDLIAEEILRNPEQLATSFMNAPNVGVAICDLQFRFRGINDALAAMNGIPAAAHFGQSIHDVLGEVAGKIEPLFRHVLATGEPIVNVHLTGMLPTRTEPGHWIENYFPLKDTRGRVNRLCSMVIEVTEQKKLEQSLRHLTGICKDGTNQLKTLMEFHKQLIARPDPAELTGVITAFVNRVIPHDYAMLSLEDDTMRWLGMDPKDATRLTGWDRKETFGAAGNTSAFRSSNLVGDSRDRSQHSERAWEQLRGQGIQSTYGMPLVTLRGKFGTLYLASRQPGAFTELDRELIEQVAMHVALAVDYACTSREIESLKHNLTEQTIVVGNPEVNRPEELGSPLELQRGGAPSGQPTLAMVERDYILQVLRTTQGKVSGIQGAAAKLGLKRTTLQSRMQKLKIQRDEYLSDKSDSPRRRAS